MFQDRVEASHLNQPGMLIQNPIIPGFHPDPSICRVGNDDFIVNLTFELNPNP